LTPGKHCRWSCSFSLLTVFSWVFFYVNINNYSLNIFLVGKNNFLSKKTILAHACSAVGVDRSFYKAETLAYFFTGSNPPCFSVTNNLNCKKPSEAQPRSKGTFSSSLKNVLSGGRKDSGGTYEILLRLDNGCNVKKPFCRRPWGNLDD